MNNLENISEESLENLAIAVMQCKDKDGWPLGLFPIHVLQDWVLQLYPDIVRNWGATKHD